MPELEDIVYSDDDEDVGVEADMNNLDAFMPVSPIPTTRIHKDHPVEQIIGDLNPAPQTRRMTKNLKEHGLFSSVQQRTNHKDFQNYLFACFLSQEEPKKVIQALKDPRYTQEEWIDYDEVFSPVARIKAIRLFLTYALFKDFVEYHMDVKSAFLYRKIEEEVYICQPLGFEDPDFLDRVYKVENALYGLHQAPRAWYETLSTYLLENRFQRGHIDKTLFIKRDQGDILIVQKFSFSDVKTANTPMETHKPLLKDADGKDVDEHMYRSMISSLMYLTSSRPDIMFIDSPFDLVAYTDSNYAGASLDKKSTIGDSNEKKLIQMIKIHTDQNVANLLSKAFDLMLLGINLLLLGKVNAARHKLTTAVEIALLEEPTESEGFEKIVDFLNANPIKYALTVNPTTTAWNNVIIIESTIRRDLQLEDTEGTKCLPTATIFEELTRIGAKTTAWNEFSSTMASVFICLATNQKFNFSKYIFDSMMKNVDTQEEMGKGSANPIDPHHTPIITQSSTSKTQKKQKLRKPNRKDTKIPQSSGPTEHIADEAANEENLPTHSNDPLLSEISSLKLRVKRLEKKGGSRTHKLKRLFKVSRSTQVVSSEDEGLSDQEDESKQGRKIDDIGKDAEDVVEKEISTADPITTAGETVTTASVEVSAASATLVSAATTTTTTTITGVDLTLAQALAELRSAKPKIMVQEPVTTLTPIPSNIKDKVKSKMIKLEKPLKKKEQIRLDEEFAFKLQAEEEEQARLTKEKDEKVEEANISWDNVQAMIDADRLLAKRLQEREQEELTDEEKARLFVELLRKRKKHFAALRAQEKRNKPPTKAQKKSTMSTYLKHMAGYKQSQLKNKSFVEIQKLFDKAMTRVNMFVDMDTELVKERSKKAEAEMA
ncbi:putative ribonuclease H-like domain-containing protein [Tanacetum coccineum]